VSRDLHGDLVGDLHREKLKGVVNGELTGDLLREVFDGDDLDEGGVGDGHLGWAHPDSIPLEAAALDARATCASAEINRRTTQWEGEPFWEGEGCGGEGGPLKLQV
jgi:hypothetical protein